MNKDRLFEIIDKAYDADGAVMGYYDADGEGGDTLAEFIVQESMDLLGDVPDDKELDYEELQELYRGLSKASRQLQSVTDAVHEVMVLQIIGGRP